MSYLCAPVYVVMGDDEEMTFWCFVEIMERKVRVTLPRFLDALANALVQKHNFLRDQSGMKKQLSTLQQLIPVMDRELYRHLGMLQHTTVLIPAHTMPCRENSRSKYVLLLPVR